MKNNLKVILLLMSILTSVSHFKVFKSYREQQILIWELNSGNIKSDLSQIKYFNYTYPTLTATAAPLATVIGKYYLRDSLWDNALQLFEKGEKDNPYLMMTNFNRSRLYEAIIEPDSAYKYSKISFFTQPNHPNHFQQYLKSYRFDLKKDSTHLDSVFKLITILDQKNIENYFVVGFNNDLITSNMKRLSKEINRENSSQKLNDLIDYIQNGKENTAKALEYTTLGSSLFEDGRIEGAIEAYELSKKLFPNYPLNLLNLGVSYYKKNNHKKSLINIEEYLKYRWDKTKDGKAYFLKALNYIKMDSLKKGCLNLNLSLKNNYKDAITAKRMYCDK